MSEDRSATKRELEVLERIVHLLNELKGLTAQNGELLMNTVPFEQIWIRLPHKPAEQKRIIRELVSLI
jgi:hypothetical protein